MRNAEFGMRNEDEKGRSVQGGRGRWQMKNFWRAAEFGVRMGGLAKRAKCGIVVRMNTLLVKKPARKKQAAKRPVPKKKDSWLGSAKGMWLDPNYDFTKPTCPHWTYP